MTGLIRKATLMSILGLLVAQAAMAGVPSASNSFTTQTCVLSSDNCLSNAKNVYVGGNGGGPGPGLRATAFGPPDVMFEFKVTLIDGGGVSPVVNYPVVVDFTACHQLVLGNTAAQTFGGITIDCSGHTATAYTASPSGTATFRLVGASAFAVPLLSDPAESSAGCAIIKVDGNQIGPRARVATPDLNNNNSGGVISGTDQGIEIDLVSFCVGNNRYLERADMNHTGGAQSDGADLSAMIDMVAYFASPSHAGNNVGGCPQSGGCCGAFQIP